MNLTIVRFLRTPYSERVGLARDGRDLGAVDLHYLLDGRVAATVTLFEDSGIGEDQIPALLTHLDEVLLPDVSIAENTLSFTVIVGRPLGNFVAQQN